MNNKRILAFLSWVLTSLLFFIGCSQTSQPNPTSIASPTAQVINLTVSFAMPIFMVIGGRS